MGLWHTIRTQQSPISESGIYLMTMATNLAMLLTAYRSLPRLNQVRSLFIQRFMTTRLMPS